MKRHDLGETLARFVHRAALDKAADVDRKAGIFADRRRADPARQARALVWLSASRGVGVPNCT
jgi:hypothetical protein